MIFVHNSLKSTKLCLPDTIFRNRIKSVCVDISYGNQNVVINCTCNPSNIGTYCLGVLSDIFCFLCKKHPLTFLAGNCNVPDLYDILHGNKQCTHLFEDFINTLTSLGLSQCVKEPSRKQNYLDLIFHIEFLEIGNTKVCALFSTSEHCKIFSDFYVDDCDDSFVLVLTRNFLKGNYEIFNAYMLSYDWHTFFDDKDSLKVMWEKFLHELEIFVNQFIPCNQQKQPAHSKKHTYPKYVQKMLVRKPNFYMIVLNKLDSRYILILQKSVKML